MVLIIPFVSLISLKLALARPAQLPVLATGHGSDSDVGLPWQDVVSLPTVDTWSLNPSGDAAVIRVSTTEIEQDVWVRIDCAALTLSEPSMTYIYWLLTPNTRSLQCITLPPTKSLSILSSRIQNLSLLFQRDRRGS